METKLVRVPFEVDLAKKITNGEVEGKIVTRDGRSARVICWDKIGNNFRIIALITSENSSEDIMSFTKHGDYWEIDREDDRDLFLEIPEYMTFKDGDVLTYRPNGDRWCIFIYKGNDSGLMHNYVTYDCDSRGHNILTFGKSSYISTLCELSTESEKQKLIDALKASNEPKAKEYLKRFFGIEQKQECKFKPFDKVICKSDYSEWVADMFSHIDGSGLYACIGHVWNHCLPYNEQTAHLLGTTEDYKEE